MTTIRIEQPVRAPLERLWAACTEARGLRAWQADEVTGEVSRGEQVVLAWPELGVSIPLRVEEVVHHERLVFQSSDARLELRFTEGQLALTHDAVLEDDERDGTHSSWSLSLAILAHYLEQHDGQQRAVHWAVARAKTSVEDAHAFFTVAGAQCAWLSRSSTGIAATGSEVAIDLAWGEQLRGRVLAHTPPRDVLVSWRERGHSVLALRTLPCPDSDDERLLIANWSSWGCAETTAVTAQLDAALQRLAHILERRASA